MKQLSNAEESMAHNLPRSLVASLDVEELERRLELSDMEAIPSEEEAMAYAESAGWEVSGSGSTAGGGTGTVTAKKTW